MVHVPTPQGDAHAHDDEHAEEDARDGLGW